MLTNKKITARVAISLLMSSFVVMDVFSQADLSSSADNSSEKESPAAGRPEFSEESTNSKSKSKESIAEKIKKVDSPIIKQPAASIAVEVNKDVITNGDIEKRLALILLSAGEVDKKATGELIQQIKEALIQEKLQQQIATHLKVSVSKEELDRAIESIAKENNMTPEHLGIFFVSKGVDIKTLRDRVESNLLWIKSVREGIGAHIHITEREVKNEKSRLKQMEEKEQFEIAEIVLFVDSPETRAHTQREAANLHKQLVDGTPFSSVARNFSQSPSSAQGGLVGWITKDQLPEGVAKIPVGRFSDPVLRGNRYIIYFVRDHKMPGQAAASEAKMSYINVKITLQPEMSIDDQTRIGSFLENVPMLEGCKALKASAKASNLEVEEVNDVSVAVVPDGIRKLFASGRKGKATEPLRLSESDLRVFMLCEQKAPMKKKMPTDEEINMALKEKRVQDQAVTQFNKLKAQATITHRTPR
ncbi:MAG: peptidylprolyl isomerase [Alphaproteobacteria bacterium]|nr:peptidylprolyl isomerase [Alphaproteobacteria bacterium]